MESSTGSVVRVLDSWAFLAWLNEEAAAGRVQALLDSATAGQTHLACSIINLGEVYYQEWRLRGAAAAELIWRRFSASESPVSVYPASALRVHAAGRLKAVHRISYADAFAIALAQELDTPVVTGDPEIRAVAATGIVTIDWLGA